MKNLTITEEIAIMRGQLDLACALFDRACTRAMVAIKKAIRSCLWVQHTVRTTLQPTGVARTVFPLEYNKNNPMSGFNSAAQGWSRQAQDAIKDYYECEDSEYTKQYTRKALAQLARVEQEIAMEELHRDALEILVNK